MIETKTLEQLRTFNNSPFPILSVYLGSDTAKAPSSELLVSQLHSMIHSHLTQDEKTVFQKDIERIEEQLQSDTPRGKSSVFFSAGDKLWQTVHFEFFLTPSIRVSTSPDTKAIISGLAKYTKYLVVLVDREKAHMFTVEQGEMGRQSEFTDDSVPQKVSSTGRDGVANQTDTNFRRNELQLKRHVDLAAKSIIEFIKNDDIHFIVVGGHKEIFKKVINSFPAPLRSKVAGSFVSELNIPLADILRESKKVAAQAGV